MKATPILTYFLISMPSDLSGTIDTKPHVGYPSNVSNNTSSVRMTDMATGEDPSVNQLLYWGPLHPI